ncbi:MAG TPA: hypothetical protein VH593_01915 [Ktedonobacteraceae bacterium]|jgi:hypothetical protein
MEAIIPAESGWWMHVETASGKRTTCRIIAWLVSTDGPARVVTASGVWADSERIIALHERDDAELLNRLIAADGPADAGLSLDEAEHNGLWHLT